MSRRPARRVVVGTDRDGRSAVVADGPAEARTARPNGGVVEEIWRQDRVPARLSDDGARAGEMAPQPPPAGVSIRVFTLPPGAGSGSVELHGSSSVYVATVVSGEARLVLETGEVPLRHGDSLVLPGSKHGWRNPADVEAVIACAVYALAE
jgi:quercetin dioxygenase-like cupin family protein